MKKNIVNLSLLSINNERFLDNKDNKKIWSIKFNLPTIDTSFEAIRNWNPGLKFWEFGSTKQTSDKTSIQLGIDSDIKYHLSYTTGSRFTLKALTKFTATIKRTAITHHDSDKHEVEATYFIKTQYTTAIFYTGKNKYKKPISTSSLQYETHIDGFTKNADQKTWIDHGRETWGKEVIENIEVLGKISERILSESDIDWFHTDLYEKVEKTLEQTTSIRKKTESKTEKWTSNQISQEVRKVASLFFSLDVDELVEKNSMLHDCSASNHGTQFINSQLSSGAALFSAAV